MDTNGVCILLANTKIMAEINQGPETKKKGVQQVKKRSTRVDLTPMVDLGFLLITFFIFTTSMQESKAMRLIMPNDQLAPLPSKHPAYKTITFLPGAGDSVFYYEGVDEKALQVVAEKACRDIINKKKQLLESLSHDGNDLLVLIKPTGEASYKSIINILDEMLINDVQHYMMLDPSNEELTSIGSIRKL